MYFMYAQYQYQDMYVIKPSINTLQTVLWIILPTKQTAVNCCNLLQMWQQLKQQFALNMY